MERSFRDLLVLFAQFEREMIAERTYEKMAEQASIGCWSGGYPMHGHDAVNKKLLANKAEARVVNAMFEKHLELTSIAINSLRKLLAANEKQLAANNAAAFRLACSHSSGDVTFQLLYALYQSPPRTAWLPGSR